MPPDSAESLEQLALDVLQEQVRELLTLEQNRDLEWLPSDFGQRIAKIAWDHQHDVDKAAFRREFRRYIENISNRLDS